MSSIKLHWSKLLQGLFCLLLAGGPAAAQTVTGTISGTVVDASDREIAGATVTVINEKTGDVRVVGANESGGFTIPALQPDVYTVKVEHKGFRILQRRNIVLSANENLALGRLALEVGQVTETVTTVAEGATVETASSDLTGRLTSDQIDLISTKGRDITSLLRLLPGISYIDDIEAVGEGFGTDLPNISGQRGRSTVSTVNGLNASELSGNNKISMTINQDAIAEVKVLRNNYAAEYGGNGGAQINIVSKRGKQDYAGSAYYYLRIIVMMYMSDSAHSEPVAKFSPASSAALAMAVAAVIYLGVYPTDAIELALRSFEQRSGAEAVELVPGGAELLGGLAALVGTSEPGALVEVEACDLERRGALREQPVGVRDLTGGFKCFRREVLEAIDLPTVQSKGYAFQVELTYRAAQAGFRIVEVPIRFRDRRLGQSKMHWGIVPEAAFLVREISG